MNEHQIYTSANILVIKEGKVLLSRRQNKSWGNGLLCLPGGHIKKSESPRQGALREAKEELGLQINPDDLDFYCVAARNTSGKEYVAYEFIYDLPKGQEPQNAEPYECSEIIWTDPSALPDDIIDDFKIIIEQGYLGKKPYLEIGY